MAEDLAELGLEGVNAITERYHDFIYDHTPTVRRGSKEQKKAAKQQQQQPQQQQQKTGPPPPPAAPQAPENRDRYDGPRRSSRQDQYGQQVYALPPPPPRDNYAPVGRQRPRRDASPPVDGPAWERNYYGRPISEAGEVTRRRYSVQPQPTNYYQQLDYGAWDGPYGEAPPRYLPPPPPHMRDGRSRSRRRTQSLSRDREDDKDGKKKHHIWDMKSQNSTKFASMAVGALAGGFVGNDVGKGDTLTTLASAVIGGLGAGQLEKQWEKKQVKREKKEKRWEDKWGSEGRDVRREEVEREHGRASTVYDPYDDYYERDYRDDGGDYRGRDGYGGDRRRKRESR